MKKASGILLIFCLLSFLITTNICAQEKVRVTTLYRGEKQNPDTVEMNRLLRVDHFNLEIVPPSIGVRFYRNGIVFLSNSKNEGKMLQSHTSFGNVETYYAALSDTVTEDHKIFSQLTTYSVPSDGMTFNKDYSVMYYTKLQGKNEPEKIYKAVYKLISNETRDWKSDPEPINICSDGSTYLNPSLSAGGDTMVFASNRKPSSGGFDLFISRFDGTIWSAPENLGNTINTPGNDLYPFLDSQNNLYFSSDGLNGSGGYDIYMCRFNGKGWERPRNLTREINTPDDELAFTISPENGKYAFFTSRSKSAKEPLKLYRITFSNLAAYLKMKTIPEALEFMAAGGAAAEEPVIAEAVSPAPARPETKITPEKVPDEGNLYVKTEKPAAGKPPLTAQKQTERKDEGVVKFIGPAEKKPEAAKNIAAEKPVTRAEPVTKTVQVKQTEPEQQPAITGVVYRVQFSSGAKSRGTTEVTFGGKTYKTFEYLYNGMYRSCVGEFRTSAEAGNLNRVVKKEGFPDAFVVAFVDNKRSLDPSLFK